MEITSKGITAYTLTDYLAKWTEYLKSKYGNDYTYNIYMDIKEMSF